MHDLYQRIRSVAGESSRVQRDIHRLNTQMQWDRLPDGREGIRSDSRTGDLFAWGAKQKKFRDSGGISVRRLPSFRGAYGLERSNGQAQGSPKLGEFLYSGSFGGRLTPARHTSSVHRNRVLFLAFLAVLVLYVAARLVQG